MAQAAKSAFKSVIQSFNVKDSSLSRLMQMLKSDLQPILNVFSGSPAQEKIYWGQGLPDQKLPPGSIYFQIDAATTAMSTMFFKRSPADSDVWRTIPNGFGNLLYSSKDVNTLTGAGKTWAFSASGPVNGPVAMATDGSIQAAAVAIFNRTAGTSEIPVPAVLTAGSIQAQVYINGVATGGIITLDSSSSSAAHFEYAVPGLIKFKAGDIISMSTAATGADTTANAEIVCTMWGG